MRITIGVGSLFSGVYIVVIMYMWWCLQGGPGIPLYDKAQLSTDLRPYIHRPYIWTEGE